MKESKEERVERIAREILRMKSLALAINASVKPTP